MENVQEEELEIIANNIECNSNYDRKVKKKYTYIDKKFFFNESKASTKD